ncbi:Aste57867_14105 [Aphanomyces stellatus]|uniref:Aste57867_14105 protein n=1 Tax=Aphanomyces stellatus TaxID=120398 RepID=A0A485KZX6_9STRA|nr:hypothetical protein As57867_014054 [Aphanomyces stellatus]VFT90933.1 Aste57867_14105 [Aphanomyces stellatus]
MRRWRRVRRVSWHETCWKCGSETGCCEFFCAKCSHIQPLQAEGACNYFKIFGIPESFEINAKKVEKLYWALQKKMHPDLYGSKSQTEKEMSIVNSALVNQAYNLLKAPTSRANYMLHLHGIDALGENSTFVDPAVLMEIMEAREAVEECTTVEGLIPHKTENAKQINRCIKQLTEALDTHEDFEASKKLTVELQYLVKLSDAILEKEEALEEA